jgi:hypothetical protein
MFILTILPFLLYARHGFALSKRLEVPPPILNESLRISLIYFGRDGTEMDHAETDCLIGCPSCGEAMRFLQTPRPNRIFCELQTFECRPCRLTVTTEQVLLQFPELLSA